jgi:hypothetical protein
VFLDTKFDTLLRRKCALDNFAAKIEICLLKERYSSK